jgi:hypothetical protein
LHILCTSSCLDLWTYGGTQPSGKPKHPHTALSRSVLLVSCADLYPETSAANPARFLLVSGPLHTITGGIIKALCGACSCPLCNTQYQELTDTLLVVHPATHCNGCRPLLCEEWCLLGCYAVWLL